MRKKKVKEVLKSHQMVANHKKYRKAEGKSEQKYILV